ncbi:MAG: N-acetylmuramoyl-L-alanine amidase [Bacteriophage sp.]|nr:MAG: N-acetylmuramoyl-L-alanine amidase [Bacteriophage sp.]
MAYTNSDLVSYENISKNKTVNRTHNIDTITIHCFVGQVTAKQGCDFFASTHKECSANYVIGFDGSIGLSVEEKDRSWCSSNRENDMRAITIEVASETSEPYSVTEQAYNALIKLLIDVCKRNNIKRLLWRNDKSLIGQVDKQNMTVHRWFAKKSCPGTYLFSNMGEIADAVNAELNKETNKNNRTIYRVQVGAFSVYENAVRLRDEMKKNGYDCFIVEVK